MPVSCRVIYSKDLELLLAAHSVLLKDGAKTAAAQTWEKTKLDRLARKYPVLFEVTRALGMPYSLWLCEPLTEYPLEDFSLEAYGRYLDAMAPEELLHMVLDLDFYPQYGPGEVRRAMADDTAAQELLEALDGERQLPFLAFRTFLRQIKELARDMLCLARDLDDESFEEALGRYGSKLRQQHNVMEQALKETDPLTYSEQLMGKTFKNRGPYTVYRFMPALFLHYKACRFSRPGEFSRVQFLIMSQWTEEDAAKAAVRKLKAMADEGRFRILTLLAEGEALRGMDIAKLLKLAPSTVSHHMDQLRQAGLIHEETMKDGKFYSLNRLGIQSVMKTLEEQFNETNQNQIAAP